MAAYADYAFYTTTFKGAAISSVDFPRLALRASERIDQITFGRAAPIVLAGTDTDTINLIKMATCAVAEEIQKSETGAIVQSERVGQHSVTYAVPTVSEDARYMGAARLYLAETGLMYRGY